MPDLHELITLVDAKKETLEHAAKTIWEFAELRFEETKSSKLLSQLLEQEGFHVDYGVAELSTAFVASYGSGAPVISFLGEFDALSSLSQKGNVSHQEALVEGESGHGCGHHLLGTGALSAAVAVRHYLESHQLPGTVRYYGCPGEEGGSGKAFMAREGVFDDVDAAITWHPGTYNAVMAMESLANYQVAFHFKGKASHAAGSPHLGRSALDAVELMNIGANYLREHMVDEARVHYAVTNAGGASPNVVQPDAEVLYLIRAPELHQVEELYRRVQKIAEGAALMTETTVDVRFEKGCSNFIRNEVMEEVMNEAFQQVPQVTFTEEEQAYAADMQKTITTNERAGFLKEIEGLLLDEHLHLLDDLKTSSLVSDIVPTSPRKKARLYGSTDVGDVSWLTPTVQCWVTCYTAATPFHSWQMVTQGVAPLAYKGMRQAALIMASTALRLFEQPELIERAKAAHQKKLAHTPYQCPIPKGIQPSTIRRS
ncbi:M20 family metallopeptidase [Aureibacillus halotolerans]|uniref:Aminobenzoyl-glutamate utilization protein B n=1 Tax=Aureibacillus halotolerans TaxID=1508390 RepID=A0A4R6U055_9BACI|nr:M20 family metallopeptidase [Aureibacillus halotolerans]TDQ37719.1 aminobenzoyl-glutamate utilization protein B [Aureibacillus halotolerans]